MPSLLKGWIDRVFTPGIAYSANDQGSLSGITSEASNSRSYSKENWLSIYATSMAPTGGIRSFRSFNTSYGILF